MDSKWTARETLCLLNYYENICEQSTKKPSFVAFKDQLPITIGRFRPDGFFSHQSCQKRAAQVVKEHNGSVQAAQAKYGRWSRQEYEQSIRTKQDELARVERLLNKVKNSPTEEDCQKLNALLQNDKQQQQQQPKELKIKTKKSSKSSKNMKLLHSQLQPWHQWGARQQPQSSLAMVTSSTETQLVVDGNYNEKDCNQVDPAWKKAAIMLWKQIADHKYASIFMSPVRDEHAKSYSTVIKEPMDLARVRKRIDQGVIRNSQSLQRDLLLIFQNAMMYNSSKTEIYRMASEMEKDVNQQVADFLGARMMVKIDA